MSGTRSPGPWHIVQRDGYHPQIHGPTGLVATVLLECDAPVLAAAPEMLEALEMASNATQRNADGSWSISDRTMHEIRAVITKAIKP